jgi:hypothetical protein
MVLSRSKGELVFAQQLKDATFGTEQKEYSTLGLGEWEEEYVFLKGRRFRFDFAWPQHLIAVEIEGGTFMPHGRHTTGVGYAKDCEKYNLATLNSWRVYRFTTRMVNDESAIKFMHSAFVKLPCSWEKD